VRAAESCDAPDDRVAVPEATIVVGPSDWEAQGRVAPRTIHVSAFRMDAFEATEARLHRAVRDGARAASGLSRAEAGAYCASRGGRLPTEEEWFAAAAGPGGTRYPWGDTGAVCRRAAWGLESGPCADDASGPDTVGAHPAGDTPSRIHDMAGNVAEWVAPGLVPGAGLVCGGSWASALATELRTWSCLAVEPSAHDRRVGVRCAYDPAP
jgi:formylglycine-generating enzyme required for sulfatase activity